MKEFQVDAKVQVVLDYFMGLIQRKNIRLVSLDRLALLKTVNYHFGFSGCVFDCFD